MGEPNRLVMPDGRTCPCLGGCGKQLTGEVRVCCACSYNGRGARLRPPHAWQINPSTPYERRRERILATPNRRPFSRLAVFERDDWTCGICAQPVDPTLRHPDPMSASLDHIVPLAKGGHHSEENTQCAHLTCNLRKGASTAYTTESEGRTAA